MHPRAARVSSGSSGRVAACQAVRRSAISGEGSLTGGLLIRSWPQPAVTTAAIIDMKTIGLINPSDRKSARMDNIMPTIRQCNQELYAHPTLEGPGFLVPDAGPQKSVPSFPLFIIFPIRRI